MSSLLKRFDADTSEESSHPSKKPRQSEASHSGTSESSSSSSSSAESFVKVPKGKSELLLANLAMFPGEDGGKSQMQPRTARTGNASRPSLRMDYASVSGTAVQF